jgi:L-fuculose-phosphate aldolase
VQTQVDEDRARADMAEVCRLAYGRGYICGTEGNFSIRLTENVVLTTPSGSCKGRIQPEQLVLTDLMGNCIDGKGRPSTELKMHLTAYKLRPDVKAIVHAHPTVAVGFSVAGVALSQCVLPEVVCALGHIPIAPYATPSTDEIPESIAPYLLQHDAIVLDHHGALTLGNDIWDAYYKLETVEHFAQTMLVAHVLGGPKPLYSSQVKKLIDICSVYGFRKPPDAERLVTAEFSTPDPAE